MGFQFEYLGVNNMDTPTLTDCTCIFHSSKHFLTQKGMSHELSPLHAHNYMQLWFGLSGSFRHVFNNQVFFQEAGDILIVPAYFPHQIDTTDSTNAEFIFCDLSDGFLSAFPDGKEKNTLFNLAYLRPLLLGVNRNRPFLSFRGENAVQIRALFYDLLNEYEKQRELSLHNLRIKTVRLLTLIALKYTELAPHDEDRLYEKYRSAIQSALNYIDEHYTEDIRMPETCKIAMMSARSFSQVFKQITGKTFTEYVQYLRVLRAQDLMLDTDWSLHRICELCGFYDNAHFCRVFKKVAHQLPSEYRNANRKEL